MKQITFTFPLPPKELSPNARVHWAKKANFTKRAREEAFKKAQEVLVTMPPMKWKQAGSHVAWYHPTLRFPDRLNIPGWLKATFDGIADTGIVKNDKDIASPTVQINKDPDRPRVEVTIWEIGE